MWLKLYDDYSIQWQFDKHLSLMVKKNGHRMNKILALKNYLHCSTVDRKSHVLESFESTLRNRKYQRHR